MRMPLFRGKTLVEEWAFGDLIRLRNHEKDPENPFIWYISKPNAEHFEFEFVRIKPHTISCTIGVKGYTGDYKNRKKNEVDLFEGDIVEAMSTGSKGTFIITYRNGGTPSYILYPAWQASKGWAIAASDLGRTKGDYYDDLRRIGNIHDNPELVAAISDKLAAYMQPGNTSALHIEIGDFHE